MHVTPLHFGQYPRVMFAMLHEPEIAGRGAALLCNPFGEDATRAFRIQRSLAERLSASGRFAFRFDYFGAGDSAGEGEDVTLEGMKADILAADEELRAASGARRIVWMAIGLGAAAAVLAAHDAPPRRLVLLSPVMNGADYLAGLRRAQCEFFRETYILSEAEADRRVGDGAESLGAPMSPDFRSQVGAYDMAAGPFPECGVDVVNVGSLEALENAFRAQGGELRTITAPDAEEWKSEASMDAFAMPSKTMDAVFDAMDEAL